MAHNSGSRSGALPAQMQPTSAFGASRPIARTTTCPRIRPCSQPGLRLPNSAIATSRRPSPLPSPGRMEWSGCSSAGAPGRGSGGAPGQGKSGSTPTTPPRGEIAAGAIPDAWPGPELDGALAFLEEAAGAARSAAGDPSLNLRASVQLYRQTMQWEGGGSRAADLREGARIELRASLRGGRPAARRVAAGSVAALRERLDGRRAGPRPRGERATPPRRSVGAARRDDGDLRRRRMRAPGS